MTIPPLSKFNLPQVLEYVSPLGCRREHLIDYLKSEALKAVCFPYCQEPDHAVAIKPDQWKRKYRDDWSFREHDGWIGSEDIEESGTQFPLTIVPDEVDEFLKEKAPDGKPRVAAATVYVLADEFKCFFDCLERHAEQGKPRVSEPLRDSLPPNRLGSPNAEAQYVERNSKLQKLATELRKLHPSWTKTEIAKHIAENNDFRKLRGDGALSSDAIEREIRLPRTKRGIDRRTP